MSPVCAESVATTLENPFIPESETRSQNCANIWHIENDGTLITLTCIDPVDSHDNDVFWAYYDEVAEIIQCSPITAQVFRAEEDLAGALIFEVPTLERANEFAAN